jgi:hypothetical protein
MISAWIPFDGGGGGERKFPYKFTFKTFKNILTIKKTFQIVKINIS